jgi:hypothetical protein
MTAPPLGTLALPERARTSEGADRAPRLTPVLQSRRIIQPI